MIAIYAPEEPVTVYDRDFWFSDGWDPLQYGRDYEFGEKSHLEQFKALLKEVPHPSFFDSKSTNSQYCNFTVEHKNCYLVTAGWGNEDCLYNNRISYCKDTLDSYIAHKTEFSYGNVYCKDSYQLFFSRDSESCNNSYFLYNCRNCSFCICSTNLRNKQYHIFNQPCTKEEYTKKIAEMNLASAKTLADLKKRFDEMYLKCIHKYAHLINTVQVTGDHVEKSKNCSYCFDLAGEAENSKFSHWGTYGLKDSYDTGPGTGGGSELLYEGVSIGVKNARCALSVLIWYSHDVRYSFNCHDSSNLFGCVGLRNKQYCIFNTQYSKDEYEMMIPRIIEHMKRVLYRDGKGRMYTYGEFFPPELSPYTYNETVAQDYFPITKDDALAAGYRWREPKEKKYAITRKPDQLSDLTIDASDNILNEVIGCAHEGKCNEKCSTAFKIIEPELKFYRKMNLPLPHLCPNCRHYERLAKRNPLKLWHRKCMCVGSISSSRAGGKSERGVYTNTAEHFHGGDHCSNEFETSYAPERQEVIYCEQCYNAEVI